MSNKKVIKVINQTDKPDNIVNKEHLMIEKCIEIEKELPSFMRDFFLYRKTSVLTLSRYEALKDIRLFCRYMVLEQKLTKAQNIKDISIDDFNKIKARDVNEFLGDYCSRYYRETNNKVVVEMNSNPSISRKKASLSVLFKFLYRNEQIENNITNAFNPIKLIKKTSDAIKKMEVDEVAIMLDMIDNGEALNEKEKQYWRKTRLRDKAIIVLFVNYGLRLSELRELNISSFNFSRGEFKIYRKRGKEVEMPINKSCEKVIKDYIQYERPQDELLPEEHRDALFISLHKKRMDTTSIERLVKKYTAAPLGVSRKNGYSPHKLRATAASTLIEQGESIYNVQNFLDHDSVITTQLYAKHKKGSKRETIKKFEWLNKDGKPIKF